MTSLEYLRLRTSTCQQVSTVAPLASQPPLSSVRRWIRNHAVSSYLKPSFGTPPVASLDFFAIEQCASYPMMNMKVVLVAVATIQAVASFSLNGPNAPLRTTALHMTTEDSPTKNINVGVIGCGRIGLVHLEAITKAPGVTPVIVSNPTVSKAEAGTCIATTLLSSNPISHLTGVLLFGCTQFLNCQLCLKC